VQSAIDVLDVDGIGQTVRCCADDRAGAGLVSGMGRRLGRTLLTLVIAQILAKKFHPFLYWATIVASTTFGTTMADFADRSLGIGYTGGSSLLLACLAAVLALWYWSERTIDVNTVSTPHQVSTGYCAVRRSLARARNASASAFRRA